jgi:hypothetical protein
MPSADKPGSRGPVQPGWTSTDLRPDQPAPISAPIPDHLGRRIAPVSGLTEGVGRRSWSTPRTLRPGASGRGGPGRSTPTSRRAHPRARLLAARPRGTRQKPQPTRGTKPRPADRSEGRTMNSRDRPLVVRGSGPLSSCCWSSPGPPCRSGPPAATRGADAMTRRSTRRVNGLGGVQGTVAPPRSDRGNSGERRTGGAVAAWAERSRV